METMAMPHIDDTQFDSPNCSDRYAAISHCILHNTSSSYRSAVNWLCDKRAQASAHLVIARDGRVASLVPLSKKAWHAGNSRINACSIGIEIEATNNQRGMTPEQEAVLKVWLKWIMQKYGVKKENIGAHRWYSNTSCPGLIWETDKEFTDWRATV